MQFIALARRARLFIGGDTGPLHLAAAVGTPIVGIYGPTDPVRNGPFAADDIALSNRGPINHTRRGANPAYLPGISVESVVAAWKNVWRGRMDSSYAAWATRWRVPLGFLLGVAYLVFCRPTVKLLLAGGAVAAAGVALRAFAAGHLVKNQSLAMSGPYAYTRNPLYLGSALMGAGFALAGGNWILALACVLLFAGIYWPVIRREEEYLRREFGEVYDQYAQQCSPFPPALSPACGW